MKQATRRCQVTGGGATLILAVAGAAAMLLAVGAAAAGADVTAPARAQITSVTVKGSPSDPTVVVRGAGFGNRPAPFPATHPTGQGGCPKLPARGNGFDYLNRLYLSDLHSNRSSFPVWTAGQSTRDLGILDCVGIVIDRYTSTLVVFHFGNAYDKHIAQNHYVLSQGDPILVVVDGARFRTRVTFR